MNYWLSHALLLIFIAYTFAGELLSMGDVLSFTDYKMRQLGKQALSILPEHRPPALVIDLSDWMEQMRIGMEEIEASLAKLDEADNS